ncbi:TPR-like protein [Clavulina sp. PMI_390]|nr:TPR-like protein [Clavulina sp. PMI_390]
MSRVVDIVLRNGQVITVDPADLDPDPSSLLELLREGECDVRAWLRIALEYWRLGQLDAATTIAEAAASYTLTAPFGESDSTALPRIHAFLANLAIARSRSAPKFIFPGAKSDVLTNVQIKKQHWSRAAQEMNTSEKKAQEIMQSTDLRTRIALTLTRANFLLSSAEFNDSLNAFEQVLNLRPNNVPAIIGKARILFVQKRSREALKLFQRALQLKPDAKPDPRTGIGLCLWNLGHKDRARSAWQRSVEVDPANWASHLLLGLDALNGSKDTSKSSEETAQLYKRGMELLQKVFKLNNSNAAAANALSDFCIRRGDFGRALKLAERTIQFSDTLSLVVDGHLRAAQVAHANANWDDARTHYAGALENNPKNLIANLGLAQIQIQNDEILAAIHGLDTVVLQSESDLNSLEALIMLASLRNFPRPALSATDAAAEKVKARDLYERVMRVLNGTSSTFRLEASKTANRSVQSVQPLREDPAMHIEISSLWQRDNAEKALTALLEAMRINTLTSPPSVSPPKLRNNIGVLKHLQGAHVEARAAYEEALPATLLEGGTDGELSSVTILYNLGRIYEDLSEFNMAKDAFGKLLGRHPEYVDAKARLAAMRMDEKRYDEAHSLVKQALATGERNSEIRAFYIWLLIQTGQHKPAKAFTFNVLKEDGHDVYALCAAGRISFNEARESRDPSPAANAARKDNFLKAANLYAKALSVDPSCAMAAQGLAILIAEDSLGSWAPGQVVDDAQFRMRNSRNAREALEVLAKVRESFQDGSVYVNMGHCHFIREEFDKAIENYETASKRFYNGQNVSVLSYLSRAWFAKANTNGSFIAMRQALKHSQMAIHLQPNDKAVLYNVAMIEQKAAELLFGLPPDRRKLSDLRVGINHATHAQKLFAALASDTARPLPYSQDIAQNRFKYGETILRRSAEHVAAQEQHEADARARVDVARRQRQVERDRLDEEQQRKVLEERSRADALSQRRKELREKTEEWAMARRAESDEEDEKRADKARKAAARKARQEANASGEENVDGAPPRKEKKKRRAPTAKGSATKRRKGDDLAQEDDQALPDDLPDEDDAVFSGDDANNAMDEDVVQDRPKKRLKKRVVEEDDDDGPSATAPSSKRKKIKSKEIIDSEDDE